MARRKNEPGSPVPPADRPKAVRRWATRALDPAVLNAMTAVGYVLAEPDTARWEAAIDVLENCARGIKDGDLSGVESLLISQAMALNAIFTRMAWRALDQGSHLKSMEAYLHLALKAQNQTRMTLETLATIKAPPIVFARQTNIANGPQQVNNGVAAGSAAHAPKIESVQTELLEASDGKRLDTGEAGAAGGADPHLETVGAGHRAAQR